MIYGIIFFEAVAIFVLAYLFFSAKEKLKLIEKEKEVLHREKEKDELKESLHTGNNHDDVVSSLNILQNNKSK